MNLNTINCVCMVAKKKSFTAAAEALFFTQAAVSKKVKAFELEIGATVFNRISTSSISLTPQGEKLIPHLEEVLRRAEVLKKISERYISGSTLKIACNNLISNNVSSLLLNSFRQKNGLLAITQIVDSLENICELLYARKVDALLLQTTHASDKSTYFKKLSFNDSIERISLFSERISILVSSKHRMAGCGLAKLNDFESDTFSLAGLNMTGDISYMVGIFLNACSSLKKPFKPTCHFEKTMDFITSLSLVSEGKLVLPSFVLPSINFPNIVAVPLDCPELVITTNLYKFKNSRLPTLLNFVNYIIDVREDLQDSYGSFKNQRGNYLDD